MGKAGLEAARHHGSALPQFKSRDEAQRVLYEQRDRELYALRTAAEQSETFVCDYTSESLKGLERWYFSLVESNEFAAVGMARQAMEQAISFYFGQVFVTVAGFQWVVEEFVFVPGRFQIGVRRGLVTIMVTLPSDIAARPGNKRRESMWREFRKWAA